MVTWHDAITGAVVGEFPDSWTDDYDFPDMLCPVCGHKCDYCEGQIDQDFQGNDINGCWWMCLVCSITSESEELGRGRE